MHITYLFLFGLVAMSMINADDKKIESLGFSHRYNTLCTRKHKKRLDAFKKTPAYKAIRDKAIIALDERIDKFLIEQFQKDEQSTAK
ncbi:hypothetical protein KSF78_0004912 [Schistosoma japonicum]|nr:hypothetical protein KSF78_0004912 [Schistosoma japonicum]